MIGLQLKSWNYGHNKMKDKQDIQKIPSDKSSEMSCLQFFALDDLDLNM